MKFKLEKYLEDLGLLIGNNAISENHTGLKKNLEFIIKRLQQLNFEIRIICPNSTAPIIYAVRTNKKSSKKVGFYAHYDVEHTNEEKWKYKSNELKVIDDRMYGRGVADNLGIFLLRFHVLECLLGSELPEIHWVFQGEEEIGAPLAHTEFLNIKIPEMNVWFEETGYFDLGTQRQRFLTLNEDSDLNNAIKIANEQLSELQFSSYTENRILTKFDECPFVKHILKNQPYFAIGPNDEYSRIHEPNESLSIPLIEKSFYQHSSILSYYGCS